MRLKQNSLSELSIHRCCSFLLLPPYSNDFCHSPGRCGNFYYKNLSSRGNERVESFPGFVTSIGQFILLWLQCSIIISIYVPAQEISRTRQRVIILITELLILSSLQGAEFKYDEKGSEWVHKIPRNK